MNRETRLDKIPYAGEVGREGINKAVSVRSRFAGDEGVKPLGEFIEQICREIPDKRNPRGVEEKSVARHSAHGSPLNFYK